MDIWYNLTNHPFENENAINYFLGPETPENLYFNHVTAVTVNLTHVAFIGVINSKSVGNILSHHINFYLMKYHVVLYDFESNYWKFLANLPLEDVLFETESYITCPLSSVIYFDKFANK